MKKVSTGSTSSYFPAFMLENYGTCPQNTNALHVAIPTSPLLFNPFILDNCVKVATSHDSCLYQTQVSSFFFFFFSTSDYFIIHAEAEAEAH